MACSEQDIRNLANQLWESEGRPEGQSEKHWKLATRLLEADEAGAHPHQKRSVDPSEKTGETEPEQPDQT
ncbi:MAG: DUF2934 domain-containing protein [Gammaproteobacteria bacterium]|nr:MAG: DUF2934 domain-containing protein [Gammaproteobacteria bacterium]